MLVFLSDIHWTDGTSGDTIHSGAFRGFVRISVGWRRCEDGKIEGSDYCGIIQILTPPTAQSFGRLTTSFAAPTPEKSLIYVNVIILYNSLDKILYIVYTETILRINRLPL